MSPFQGNRSFDHPDNLIVRCEHEPRQTVAVSLDLRRDYRAEGLDRVFAAELLAELERRNTTAEGAWLLTVRNSRWRAVALAGGPPGLDVRFALDPVPSRSRPIAWQW